MPPRSTPPSRREITFGENEIIVTKTDLRGSLTYANDVFLRVAGYTEKEVLGKPHNLIRHPEMPRSVFWLLWDTIKAKQEIFAYVVNQAKNGDHYWVFAHVTPSFDAGGRHVGYHSNRRSPHAAAVAAVRPLYAQLVAEEQRHSQPAAAIEAGVRMLTDLLASRQMNYAQFIFSLTPQTQLDKA
jgi:PAS domain S-box-containing protein